MMATQKNSPDVNSPLRAVDTDYPNHLHSHGHAICWAAVFAGATAAAALTIILCILGTGLGFTAVSPWSSEGISATTLGISAILWLSLTQVVASGMGGFLAGRLRSRKLGVHADEVYFRDTAHGFLTWSIALLVTSTLFASALGSVINGGVQAAAKVSGGAIETATAKAADNANEGYFIDTLFRKNATTLLPKTASTSPVVPGTTTPNNQYVTNGEVRRIFQKAVSDGELNAEDKTYLSQIVAQRAGIPPEEADKRIDDAYAAMQETAATVKAAADKARKASAAIALWGFIALLIGAFSASLAATWGGRCRDANTIVS
jgi:hypothetical protein